jgi:RNA polymerase sigma factor (sigma-70 family)
LENDNSFARLIAPVKGQLFETVWRILRHTHDAEDALQNALTTVWQQRARIERHSAPQALMLKICADAAIDQFRRRRRDRREQPALATTLPSAQPPPVDGAIGNEMLEIVVEAITSLSPNQATAIVMRFIQGESDAAIAAALGCGPATVREHLSRGRDRLRRMLGHLAPHSATSIRPASTHLHHEDEQ